MDALNRSGRFDSLLTLKSAGNQSSSVTGTTLDLGSSIKSSFCIVDINSISGTNSPMLSLRIEASNDGQEWTIVAGARLDAVGLFRLALGDRGYRYWRYDSDCEGDTPVINWSAYLTAD